MTGKGSASELARRLAEDSEAVCREYLSSGRRCGNYWMVGDVRNTPGRSMHVRLKDTPKGPAGNWVDEAIGRIWRPARRHPRKLRPDRIPGRCRRGAALPQPAAARPEPEPEIATRKPPAASGSPDAARRLFAMAKPLAGTLAERYLQARGIPFATRERSLRFHPGCYFRDLVDGAHAHPARADRRHHQLRRSSHRRPADFPVSHRARPGRGRQGARRRSAPLDGQPSRQRHPARLRCRLARRGHGRRRRPRDDAFAQDSDARNADGRRHLGQSPRRPQPAARLRSASTSRPTRTPPAGTVSSA